VNARPARGYPVSRETPNLTERTTQILREAILQLRLKPGERLVERDLAGQTGASRTCVRAAMQQLRTEGLVERSSGGMLSVASISPDEATQIYEVRAALEPAMARLFAARATEEEQAALKAATDDAETAVQQRDQPTYVAALNDFYDVLARGSGNEVAHRFITMLDTRITYLRRLTADRSPFDRETETARLLRELQIALAARDGDLAASQCEAAVARSARFALMVLADPDLSQPPAPEVDPEAPEPAALPRQAVACSEPAAHEADLAMRT
jgi:DNA-binding GntR family transcriptional regulator